MGRIVQIICGCVLAAALGAAKTQPASASSRGPQVAQSAAKLAASVSAAEASDARDTQRAEADLKAQQEMARWALGMFVASGLSVLLGAVSVGLIYSTFQQTRRAADSADEMAKDTKIATQAARDSVDHQREMDRARMRPWLSVTMHGPYLDHAEVEHAVRSTGKNSKFVPIKAAAHVANLGDVPAVIRSHKTWVIPTEHAVLIKPDDWEVADFAPLARGETYLAAPPMQHGIGLLSMDTGYGASLYHMHPTPIVGWVRYEDTLGKLREHGYGFLPGGINALAFSRWGGDQYNYDREIGS